MKSQNKTKAQLLAENEKLRRHTRKLEADEAEWIQTTENLRLSQRELIIRNRITTIFLTLSDEEMYNEVLNAYLEAMESKFGVFGYIDENGALIVPSMTRHIWDQCKVADKRIVFPRDTWGESTWPRCIREKRVICQNELSNKTPEGHIAVDRHISQPIIYQGEIIGLMLVANKETDYDQRDLEMFQTISDHIAPVLKARLQRDFEERERRRVEDKALKMADEIRELSTPLLSLRDNILVMPLIGTLDSRRTQEAMEKALTCMAKEKATALIVDITGVPTIDTMVANHLIRMARAVRLMGGECIITGLSPTTAQTIVHLGVDLSGIHTLTSLGQGLSLAMDLVKPGRHME